MCSSNINEYLGKRKTHKEGTHQKGSECGNDILRASDGFRLVETKRGGGNQDAVGDRLSMVDLIFDARLALTRLTAF